MELSENNNLFQTVFDSASNGIALMRSIHDYNGKVEDFEILLFNKYTLNWIGDTDYKNKRYSEVFPTVKETGILQKFIEVAETGVSDNFEQWYVGEGMNHWFHFTAVKKDDFLVVTTQDVTEHKQNETNLINALDAAEKQRRLYDSITNTTPDLVYVFGLDYTFTYANKALLAMWGKSAENAIGKGLRDNGYEEWHALMHEREIDTVVAEKKLIRGKVSFPHAEFGSRVYDYILGPVFNAQGEVDAVAGTTRDITDLKRTENSLLEIEMRLRSMISQTPAATLVLLGDNLIIDQINESMLHLIGFGEEAIGKPLIELLPELKGQYVWEQVQKVYTEGIPFDQHEVPVSHKRTGSLEQYYYNLAYRPLKEDGKIIGMIQVAIDVTDQVVSRKKLEESENRYKKLSETLEEQIKERTKELQRSNGDLQQFAHVASHDLKEPIRKIKTFIYRLEEQLHGKLDASGAMYVERIHVATDRMFTMIDGVLAFSSIDAETQQPEPVNINEIINHIETDLEVALQKANGKINFQNLPTIEGAHVLLYQLFYNLINNSIKFAKEGTPLQISIISEIIAGKGKECAKITVSDNGIGFDPQYAARIFETFARLNSKDAYEGTGLGLSLCKKIVERHGGSITAESSSENGAIFVITLPLSQTDEDI